MTDTTARDGRVLDRRRVLAGSGALGIASLVLPAASAAASPAGLTTYACSDAPWSAIPFLAQGEGGIVGGVTVTATENSAVQGYDPFVYLHQNNDRIRTVLTFSATVPELRVRTQNHADGGSERYDLTFRRSGATVLTDAIQNQDVNYTYSVVGGFDTLVLDYSHPVSATPGAYGSFILLDIPCE